jgi:hypothetical protein
MIKSVATRSDDIFGTRSVGAYRPDGVPLFLIHRTPTGSHLPETAVLDPGGATRAVVRRVAELPPDCALLAPDGRRLGWITPTETRGAYSVRDADDREVGTLVARGRGWIVQLQDGTALRDPALAFAVDSYRLLL